MAVDGVSGVWDAAVDLLASGEIQDERHLRNVVALARHHRIETGVVDHLVRTRPATSWLATHRDEVLTTARLERLRALHVLDVMRRSLPVDFLVVKGPALAMRWYGEPSHRPFGDLDILVRRADFTAALGALEAAGAAPLSTNWHGFARYEVAEVPVDLRSSTIDLHWDLVALGRDRASIRFDTDALFERSVDVDLGGVKVRTLDDVDTLIHCCVNFGLDGARRLGRLIDIAHIASRADIDADLLAARARDVGAGALCSAVLQRTRLVLGTDIPDELIRPLQPWSGWLVSNALVDRRCVRSSADSVAPGIWLSAGRAQRRATFGALVDRISTRVAERAGRPSRVQPGGALDWQRKPVDLDAARRAYVSWVDAGTGSRVLPRVGPDELLAQLEPYEPRTTPLLGASRSALRSRWSGRADLVVRGDRILGALLTERWLVLRRVGYPVVFDVAAAPALAGLVDQLHVTDLAGFEEDLSPLRPLIDRWRGTAEYTAATLPPGFRWGPAPQTTRAATHADLDDLTTIMWTHAAHGFPSRFLLRRRLRRSIDELVVVTLDDDRIVGFAARDSSTRRYHYWAHIVIEPDHRGAGRSWDLVAAAAAAASEAGAGLLGFGAASNPMPVPADALLPSTWLTVSLAPPRRWPGEPRLRESLDRLIGRRMRTSPELDEYRRPGREDELVTDRRTQATWNPVNGQER